MRVRARHAAPGSPGDTEERRGDAGAGFVRDGLAGSNRILFLLRVAVVSPSDGGRVRGKAGARAAVAANPGEVYTDWPLASLCAPPSPDANCCADCVGSRGRQDRMPKRCSSCGCTPCVCSSESDRRAAQAEDTQEGQSCFEVSPYPPCHASRALVCVEPPSGASLALVSVELPRHPPPRDVSLPRILPPCPTNGLQLKDLRNVASVVSLLFLQVCSRCNGSGVGQKFYKDGGWVTVYYIYTHTHTNTYAHTGTGVVDDLYGRFFCAPRTRNHVFICHRALKSCDGTDTRARTRLRPSTHRHTHTHTHIVRGW